MENYLLINTARSRHNRQQRAANATHKGLVQHLEGNVRVVRGRPTIIGREKLMSIIGCVRSQCRIGLLEVRSMDGRLVDVTCDKFVVAPLPSVPPTATIGMDTGMKVDTLGKEKLNHSEMGDTDFSIKAEDLTLPEPFIDIPLDASLKVDLLGNIPEPDPAAEMLLEEEEGEEDETEEESPDGKGGTETKVAKKRSRRRR